MSLLMDALKRAEQEKKEAAKRIKQTGPNPIADTGEHLIHPGMENTGPHETTRDMDLSLEPLERGRAQAESIPEDTNEYAEIENTSEMPVVYGESDDDDGGPIEDTADMEIVENTQEMGTELPAAMNRERQNSYDNTLEEDMDDNAFDDPFLDSGYSFDETLDSVTASQLAADLGGGPGQPTPVAAHTVFEASRGSAWSQGGRWVVIGTGALILLILGGVVVHYQTTPVARDIPSPVALPEEIRAQQAAIAALPKPRIPAQETFLDTQDSIEGAIETPETSVTPEVAVTETETEAGTGTTTEDAVSEITADAGASQQAAAGELPPMEMLVGSEEESGAAAITDTETPAESPASAAAQDTEAMTAETEETVAMAEPGEARLTESPWTEEIDEPAFEPIAPSSPIRPEMIRISRSTSRDMQSGNNQQAYRAYQSGDLARAESLYKSTLADAPENRDAILGLAAIRMRQNDRAAAYLLYRKLLQLNPSDGVARLALLNMQGAIDPIRNESLLKLMLADKPASPHLYFSLGTLYAAQEKWAAAQQAFFEAYSLDNENPDYALNLAVSLDRMGQSRPARDYYEKAVELADKRPASFTTSDVLTRLQALRQLQSS
jgi:thioredoxin-like negative regulator of GroEL